MASASGRPMPGTAARSSSVASRTPATEPKRRISALRRAAPMPGIASSWLWILPRSLRW